MRIDAQLIDAARGTHIWADRFDGQLEDVFDLQDLVAERVAGALEPRIRIAEIERSRRKPTENMQAYDNFLRALAEFHRTTKEPNREAVRLLERAIELDGRLHRDRSFQSAGRTSLLMRGVYDGPGPEAEAWLGRLQATTGGRLEFRGLQTYKRLATMMMKQISPLMGWKARRRPSNHDVSKKS